MELDAPTLTALLSLIGTVTTPIVLKFGVIDKLRDDLAELKTFQAEDKIKIDLFWSVIQSRVASLVKAPTHDRLDELVEKFEQHIASLPELKELEGQLALRSAEEGLKPIQSDAIEILLIFLAERIAAKHKASVTGKPNRTITQPLDTRSATEKRAHQVELEAEQVEANERKAPDVAVVDAVFDPTPTTHGELTEAEHVAVQKLSDETKPTK